MQVRFNFKNSYSL